MYIVALIILLVVIVLLIKKQTAKVNPEDFKTIIDFLNQKFFSGDGKITMTDNYTFQLYDGESNRIVIFHYSNMTRFLTVTCKYKYWQQEVVYKDMFEGYSKEQQTQFVEKLYSKFVEVKVKHEAKVDANPDIAQRILSDMDRGL